MLDFRKHFSRTRGVLLSAALLTGFSACGGAAETASSTEASASASAPDGVVELDSAALRLARVELVTAAPAEGGDLVLNGTIAYDEDRAAVVAPRAESRVVAVRADLGGRVARGATLALLESTEVGQTRGDLAKAAAQAEVARRNYERERALFEQKITSEKEMQQTRAEYEVARAEAASARAGLSSLGATRGEGGAYALLAPVAGTVVERNVMPGQVVGPESTLFTVADLRHLWITVDAYEQDLPRIRKGSAAAVATDAFPERTFHGVVTYAGGVVDPTTRTFKVRVELDNPGQQLRPGMQATVRVDAPAAPGSDGDVVVPEIAVQELNGRPVVFLPTLRPGSYVARPVEVGESTEAGVRILAGLRPGEQVVARGAFQLRAELTKSSFGDDDG